MKFNQARVNGGSNYDSLKVANGRRLSRRRRRLRRQRMNSWLAGLQTRREPIHFAEASLKTKKVVRTLEPTPSLYASMLLHNQIHFHMARDTHTSKTNFAATVHRTKKPDTHVRRNA